MLADFSQMMRRINWLPFAAALLLSVIGVLFVYSACSIRTDPSVRTLHLDHATFAAVGLVLAGLVAALDYRWMLRLSPLFYVGTLGLLALVLLVGTSTMGARRWVFGIQPSEPAKLAIVMVLAWILGSFRTLRGVSGLLAGGAVAAVPVALILAQPDLGTALVIVPTLFVMLFAAGVAPRVLWSLVAVGVLAVGFVLGAVYAAEKMDMPESRRVLLIKATGLRPHQLKRVDVFLFPDRDIYGSGYNKRQSEIAVGSGGIWGKGYLRGDQNMLGYLPPSVSANDFIFPVLAEETGFVGGLALLAVFWAGLLLPGLWIAYRCRDDGGRLLAIGITTLIFCHLFINISMTVGLVPITGIPLPFISYGGTFMLTMMLAVGLLGSVAVHGGRKESLFKV